MLKLQYCVSLLAILEKKDLLSGSDFEFCVLVTLKWFGKNSLIGPLLVEIWLFRLIWVQKIYIKRIPTPFCILNHNWQY